MVGMMPNRVRAFVIVMGLILVAIGLLIVLYPGLTITFLLYLLAFGLMIMGLERIISGILG
jgi:uncharacterized membrane protein HdeD (DUF308 family)